MGEREREAEHRDVKHSFLFSFLKKKKKNNRADQDHDGSHIKGLVINLFAHFWPSLLKLPGFLTEFITPIVKVSKGRVTQSFFTIPEYEQWKSAEQRQGWKIKYYKGSTPFFYFFLFSYECDGE